MNTITCTHEQHADDIRARVPSVSGGVSRVRAGTRAHR